MYAYIYVYVYIYIYVYIHIYIYVCVCIIGLFTIFKYDYNVGGTIIIYLFDVL